MQFKKFSSLENTYNKSIVSKVVYEGLDGGNWMVTSKIHGANFGFWYNGEEFKVSSRTQFVDGSFFGCQPVINKHEDAFKEWYHKTYPEGGKTVAIYGELFGTGIQKEIFYGEKKFRAFDVVIDDVVVDKVGAQFIVAEAGFEFVPVLFVGSFAECMAVNNVYRSLLTPPEFEGDNFEEGNVIEPIDVKYFKNGKRVYLKNKTSAFTEKNSRVSVNAPLVISDENKKILEELVSYVNENRVRNVLSKLGKVAQSEFGKLLGMTAQDAIEDYEKDTGTNLKKVVDADWKAFVKAFNATVTSVVRPVFIEQLED